MNEIAKPGDAGDEEPRKPDGSQRTRGKKRKASRPRQADSILSEAQCLAGLSRLPGLLAFNMIKADKSNAMLGAFREILRHHSSAKDPGRNAGIVDDDMLAVLRKNPELFQLLEPLLTDEQIELILNDEQDGKDEEV